MFKYILAIYSNMYFWGTPDTSVSFCEEAYADSTWIAEYYNTMSSFLYLFVGWLFLHTNIRPIAIGVIWIGLGSIMLHGTMRYYGQWADELAMLLTSFYGLRYHHPIIPQGLILCIVFFYLSFYKYFIIFFISIVCVNVYLSMHALKSAQDLVVYKLYIFFFAVGGGCWIIDKFFCDYVQHYYLHAWWHVFTSLGLFSAMYGLYRSDYKKIKDEKTP